MAQNPYYVEPANIMPGLSAVASAIKGRGARELEAAKERKILAREKQKETEAQAKREEGARLLESGTPDEIAAFMVKNPEAGKTLSGAMKFKSEETKQRLLDKVRGIYTGQLDPLGASIEHAESLIQEGADPSDTMELAKISAQDPEAGREEAGRVWAGLDPGGFMKSKQAMGETVSDPGKETAKIQQWNEYNRLKKIDPKQATLFASSVGIDETPEAEAFNFTDDEKDRMAVEFTQTGEYPLKGRSKEVIRLQAEIKKRSLEQQKAQGIADVTALYNRLDKKGMQKDIDAQQGKLGSMRSFISNIDKQAAKINEVGERMKRFDTKFLNIPLNKVIDAVGDADRATFRLLVGELSEEIGKLASGATNSVAALSEGGREKWDKIFDTNLSYNDMMELVKESKEIAHMRVDSMKESLKESRKIIRETPRSKVAAPKYKEGDTANGGKLIFTGGVWKDNV